MAGVMDWLLRPVGEPQVDLGGRVLPIAIRHHATARRMTMRLAPDGSEVRITVPRWCRTAEALDFAHARAAWLAAQLASLPRSEPPAAGGTIAYRGREFAIDWSPRARRKPHRDGEAIRLGGPADTIPARLRRWLEQEALALCTDDLAFYCARAGLAVPGLRLSRAQRRWGSCSGRGEVRINWRLVQAPDHVRRSVVAHEVAHLLHFDHSPQFHAELGALFEGDLAAANRWLKAHGRSLYAAFG